MSKYKYGFLIARCDKPCTGGESMCGLLTGIGEELLILVHVLVFHVQTAV